MSFFADLIESIWQPGVNRALLFSIHATFICLFASTLVMYLLVKSAFVLSMIPLNALLYLTLLWFIKEADLMNRHANEKDSMKKER